MSNFILDSTASDLKNAQIKITWLGEQTKPISTVIFYSSGYSVKLEQFAQFHPTKKLYGNDSLPYTKTFSVNTSELGRMLSSIKPVISKIKGPSKEEFISFTLVIEKNKKFIGEEFRIGESAGRKFYVDLIGALDGSNDEGNKILSTQFANIYAGGLINGQVMKIVNESFLSELPNSEESYFSPEISFSPDISKYEFGLWLNKGPTIKDKNGKMRIVLFGAFRITPEIEKKYRRTIDDAISIRATNLKTKEIYKGSLVEGEIPLDNLFPEPKEKNESKGESALEAAEGYFNFELRKTCHLPDIQAIYSVSVSLADYKAEISSVEVR